MKPPLYLVGRSAAMESDFAEHLGITLKVRSTDDPEEGWLWVKRAIDAGEAPMVWADIGHLEYLRVQMHNTHHDILVVGYDEEEGIAWIADNDRDGLQACSLASLARARSSDSFPGPNRHTTFFYEWPTELPEPRPAVRAAVARAVANMKGRAFEGGFPPGTAGLEGVERFARSYAEWPRRLDDRLPDAMRALRVFIVKAGTGGALFRSLQARFFQDFAAVLDDRDLDSLAVLYGELAECWVTLAESAARPDHAGGLGAVEEIGRLEREGLDAMMRWLVKMIA